MKDLLDERFFQLLLECSQRNVSKSELMEALNELAMHIVKFRTNEQDYSVLFRYFFGFAPS